MIGAVVLCVLAAQVPISPPVHGRISADGSGEPIAGVMVEEVDGPARAFSDSLGRYTLRGLGDGPGRVRFSRFGYRSRVVDVAVRGAAPLRLDVTLPRDPLAIPGLEADPRGVDALGIAAEADAELGLRRYRPRDRAPAGLAGRPDPLALLGRSPDAHAGLAAGSVLRVRGGAADQNLVLLDGAPMYAPFHGGTALTAVDPDALRAVTLHEGVAPAGLGGALSSVVEMESRAPAPRLETRAAADVFAARGLVSGPLPGGGGFLLSGQRGLRDVFAAIQGETSTRAGFDDLFGKLQLHAAGGALEAFGFGARDAAGFLAVVDTLLGADSPVGRSGVAPRNRFAWSSGTVGLRWRRGLGAGVLRVVTWDAALDAGFGWLSAGAGEEGLRSRLGDVGGRAALSFPLAGGWADAGVEVRRLGSAYAVAHSSVPALTLRGTAALGSAFLEEHIHAGRWSAAAGLRGTASPSLGVQLAPRVSVRYAAGRRLDLGLGFARTYQYAQSLRNEESVLSTVSAVPLPAVADGRRIPVAAGDEGTATLGLALGPGVRLEGDGYVRRLTGLVLVPAATGEPFTAAAIPVGRGRAAGATLRLDAARGRLALHAGYGAGVSTRSTPGTSYRVSLPARTLAASLALRAGAASWLVGALDMEGGRVTSPLAGGFTWTPDDPLDDVSRISGSPRILEGTLNSQRLPGYVRLDLGVRHAWTISPAGEIAQRLTLYVDVRNVLGRANQLATSTWPDGTSRPLLLLPRSLIVGISWQPARSAGQAWRSRSAVASR